MKRVISADPELLPIGGRAEGVEYPLGRRGSRVTDWTASSSRYLVATGRRTCLSG
jgi:hypothetical protein